MITKDYAIVLDLAARLDRGYKPRYGEKRRVSVPIKHGDAIKFVSVEYEINPVNLAAAYRLQIRDER